MRGATGGGSLRAVGLGGRLGIKSHPTRLHPPRSLRMPWEGAAQSSLQSVLHTYCVSSSVQPLGWGVGGSVNAGIESLPP